MKCFGDIWADLNPPLPADLSIHGLSLDSSQVERGDLFFGLQGVRTSGARYLSEAQAAGAAAALIDVGLDGMDMPSSQASFPIATVFDLRYQISGMAARFFDMPAIGSSITGVTGTNGKSSVCYWAAAMFTRLGYKSGVCGSLGFGRLDALQETDLTTPDAIKIQRILSHFDELGCDHIFMEASSHGLAQGRVAAVPFQRAVFTNLSRDHLDYHGDMASYWQHKKKLFSWPTLSEIVVNIDDPKGHELCTLAGSARLISYGMSPDAEVRFSDIKLFAKGFDLVLWLQDQAIPVRVELFGRYNLHNILATCALAHALGAEAAAIADALGQLPHVPGRMQPVFSEQGCTAVIDYAHSPGALRAALLALRERGARRLFCVFGCGGDRDRGKRPIMGAIASQLADAIWLTNDNPRSEDPAAILQDIKAGTDGAARLTLMPDRADAIRAALTAADPEDLVLIAGKGHEHYQVIGDQSVPSHDLDIARDCLRGQG